MDFGKVSDAAFTRVDFSLPADPPWNTNVLPGEPVKTKFYVGLPKWGSSEWVGNLYPLKTKDPNFLDEYAKHYNAIELGATHYKFFQKPEIEKWVSKVKDKAFYFIPKVHQAISHKGSLSDKQFLTNTFLESVRPFAHHLGPIFLQVSDRYSPERRDELFEYFRHLPKDLNFFFEVRHPDWFLPPFFNELLMELKANNIGFVITDTPGRRDVAHMHLTVPKVHIRFVSTGDEVIAFNRMDQWAGRFAEWQQQGLQEAYLILHTDNDANAPEQSRYLIKALNKACAADLKEIEFIPAAKGLFD